MPIETSLPFPDPSPNMRVVWPQINASLPTPGPFNSTGSADGLAEPVVWRGSQGAGTDDLVFRNGILCAEFTQPKERACSVAYFLQVTNGNLAPGYVGVEYLRVYRLAVQLALGGALTNQTGLQFAPSAASLPAFTRGGFGAFGVLGDGAGGWEYVQSDNGAFPGNITDTVAIPIATVPDATDWNTFVFEFINSAPGRNATFTLTVNGILVVSRNWVAPLALPDYSELLNSNKMVWGINASDVGISMFVGPFTIEMGRFTAAGLEILS